MYVYQYGLLFPFLLALLTWNVDFHYSIKRQDYLVKDSHRQQVSADLGKNKKAGPLLEDSAFISNFIIR